MIVIASIHQPSTSTLLLFDNVLLLSEGQMAYFGPPGDSIRYFKSLGYPEPQLMSPAEFMLELANTDFVREEERTSRLDHLIVGWGASRERRLMNYEISLCERNSDALTISEDRLRGYPRTLTMQSLILLHRIALVLRSAETSADKEIVSRSPCLWCPSRHVSRTCNSHGYSVVTSLLFAREHSKCRKCIILRQCLHKFYGANTSCHPLTSRLLHTYPPF